MVEVDAVEDLMEFAKIEHLGGTIPQLTKTGSRLASRSLLGGCVIYKRISYFYNSLDSVYAET